MKIFIGRMIVTLFDMAVIASAYCLGVRAGRVRRIFEEPV